MTRRILAAGLVALVTVAMAQTEDALRKAEEEFGAALARMDYAALDKILADDMIYTHSNGVVDDKAQFIASLKDGTRKYESIKIHEFTVRPYGNTAAVAAKVTMVITARGTTAPRDMRYLRFWAKKRGQWQLVGHQSVTLPK
ncbi:MAG: nuclear transport factor 2 family protein [Bryobacterales bacterium]|jgi:ketosteroid isomerase-like protein|nr:nuclear transport factor 2 family protein [Bryobacterales bacterium]